MSGLLVLGSKPKPALPPRASFDAVACANASGYSAATHQLPVPLFTVMSAILPAVASGRQSLRALAGLSTETLYFFPRPTARRNRVKQLASPLSLLRMQPFYLRRVLRSVGYRYEKFVEYSHDSYDRMIMDLCDHDHRVLQQIQRKQPSTGATVLAIGLAEQQFDRYILSGFSFELTHAYANNPEIAERKSKLSRHADTDIAVMGYLARRFGNVFTTEAVVHQRAGIPLLPALAEAGSVQNPTGEE
jgi:hypothetical protein